MPSLDRSSELLSAFAREWATVLGALLGGPASVERVADPASPADWRMDVAIEGAECGFLTIGLAEADAVEMSRRVMGLEEPPPEAAVLDTLREVGGQAAGALGQVSVAVGLTFKVDASHGGPRPNETAQVFRLAVGPDLRMTVAGWAAVVAAEARAEANSPQTASGSVQGSYKPTAPGGGNLDVLMDIDLPITVRFGSADMTLHALTRLGPGSVIDLGRSPDDPVEVLISGKVVARGEVVVVTGNYGVRITEVVSTTDRIRSMGA
ncbi:MAG: flagellar motor switch protein FliN [Acidobacteriota bacterium]